MSATETELSAAVDVAEAAKRLRVSGPTVYRWVQVGVDVPGRGRVRLAAVRVGGHYLITPDAIDMFLVACNPIATAPTPSPAAIQRRGKEAQRQLADRLGGGK